MSITKNIGGDRLGSGNKMNVKLHGFERSTHDLSRIVRTTMAPGTLVPFFTEIGLNGDTFDIDLDAMVRTMPTNAPLFGSFKLQMDIFQIPIRLYLGVLHNNPLNIGMNMKEVYLPMLQIQAPDLNTNKHRPIEIRQFDQSCLLAYLGIRGIGVPNPLIRPSWQALPVLSYYDIYKNYYANKQEEKGFIISAPKQRMPIAIEAEVNRSGFEDEWLDISPEGQINKRVEGSNEGHEQIPLYTDNSVDRISFFFENPEGITLKPEEILIDIKTDANKNKIETISILEAFSRYFDIIESTGSGIILYGRINILPLMIIYKIHNPTASNIQLLSFPLSYIDEMRNKLLRATTIGQAVTINTNDTEPYRTVCGLDQENNSYNMYSQNGLAIKTYQSDIFNNWISTEWIDGDNGINAITAIDTSSGSFNMDTLNLSKKVYDMLNRIAVSGGSYEDWQEAVYGEKTIRRAETPMYMGGLSSEIVFEEVVSTADTETGSAGTQPLGSLAGKGTLSGKRKGGSITIHVKEPSIIMGIASITPRIDYSQGNKWFYNLNSLDDLHKPSLDGIGFQDLLTTQMSYTEEGRTPLSAGKQPAWINYMTSYNECYGEFANPNTLMFMTLNRKYEIDEQTFRIKDLTTYIDPTKFNYAFADTRLDAQNFWMQFGINITARRKMSAKIIPNL